MKSAKASPVAVNFDTTNPPSNITFIVGQWPGKQRKNAKELRVFHGNRTGDFIQDAIHNCTKPIYLTNAHNWYRPRVDPLKHVYLRKGHKDLVADIRKLKPSIIIALGVIAGEQVISAMKSADSLAWLYIIEHPSYILRFNKNIDEYQIKLHQIIHNA